MDSIAREYGLNTRALSAPLPALMSDDVKGPPFPEAEEALRQVSESAKVTA